MTVGVSLGGRSWRAAAVAGSFARGGGADKRPRARLAKRPVAAAACYGAVVGVRRCP